MKVAFAIGFVVLGIVLLLIKFPSLRIFLRDVLKGTNELAKVVTFNRLVKVALIIALIVIGKNTVNWIHHKSVIIDEKTVIFKLVPNVWDSTNFGWQKIEGAKGRVRIVANGSYEQYFSGEYIDNYQVVNISGISNWPAPYKDKLPMPDRLVGSLIGKIGQDGVPFYIGRKTTCFIPEGKELWVTINVPQNFAEKGNPEEVFNKNRGSFNIEVVEI